MIVEIELDWDLVVVFKGQKWNGGVVEIDLRERFVGRRKSYTTMPRLTTVLHAVDRVASCLLTCLPASGRPAGLVFLEWGLLGRLWWSVEVEKRGESVSWPFRA